MSLLSEIAIAIKTKLGGTSVNNTIPRYDGTACKLKKSDVTISDTNVVTAGGGFVGNLTGTASNATLAASATRLTTACTINGVAFDGTANITVVDSTKAPLTGGGASGTWAINITGNAATSTNATTASNATKLNSVVEDVNATANTIVKRDDNGYIKGVYFNTTAGDTTTVASHYYVETGSDGYVRPKPLASVKSEIAGDRAPLASPALTGTPTAPTASVGTNTTQLATTAFVNAKIANDAPSKTGTGASGTWGINVTGNAGTATKLATAGTITVGNTAKSFDGSANIAFSLAEIGAGTIAGDVGQNGYVKFSNGLIIQWGLLYSTSVSTVTLTFPIAFPTACLWGTVSAKFDKNDAGGSFSVHVSGLEKTHMTSTTTKHSGSVPAGRFWMAIGY